MPSASSPAMSLREPDAARAKNAALVVEHDARAEINALGLVNFRLDEAARALAVIHGVFLELAFARLVADRAIERMIDEQRFQHAFAHLLHAGRARVNLHARAKSAWRRRWPGAATLRSSACRRDSTPACDPGPAPACRTRRGTCGNCPRPAASDDSNSAALRLPRDLARLHHRRGRRFALPVRRELRHFDFAPVHLHLDLFDRGRRGLGFGCGCC